MSSASRRDHHPEGCPRAFTLELDLTIVLENDLPAQGQPQPCPIRSSGEERLEQVLADIRGNSRPGVRNTNLHCAFLRFRTGTAMELPTLGHGLQGIGRQVQEQLRRPLADPETLGKLGSRSRWMVTDWLAA